MKCFKCEKEMEASIDFINSSDEQKEEIKWESPKDGVQFEGGWNFGSSIYDAMLDGIYVEIVICDECLKAAKDSDRMRERIKVRENSPKSIPANKK